jgi:hypothetical protein
VHFNSLVLQWHHMPHSTHLYDASPYLSPPLTNYLVLSPSSSTLSCYDMCNRLHKFFSLIDSCSILVELEFQRPQYHRHNLLLYLTLEILKDMLSFLEEQCISHFFFLQERNCNTRGPNNPAWN